MKKRKDKDQLPEFMNKNIKKITHPKLILPEAQSIIALALSYNISLPENEEAFISKYSRGKDYHLVMKNKMKKVVSFLENIEKKVKVKILVDTGPLLEREVATRAGIGWIGKNTNLINPQLGSYLFLGEIITNLNIEPTEKNKKNKCQNCYICIENCPGGALNKENPYFLDENKCISYLTQKKGILSEAERELIGINLWG